jgi:hypothetical protein
MMEFSYILPNADEDTFMSWFKLWDKDRSGVLTFDEFEKPGKAKFDEQYNKIRWDSFHDK